MELPKHPRKKLTAPKYKALCMLIDERDCGYDGYPGCCVICGEPHVQHHHVTTRGSMGDDSEKNIVCLCPFCHQKKAHGQKKVYWKKQFKKYLQSDRVVEWRAANMGRIKKIEGDSKA